MITCITISERPWAVQQMPRRIRHVNLVAGGLSRPDLHGLKLDAILAVDTQDYFFQDAEDPLPTYYLSVPPEAGLLTGPIKIDDHRSAVPSARHYTRDFHHVIRSFVNTKKAQHIARMMPRGYFDTDVLMHYFLEKRFGVSYNKALIMSHRATPGRANGLDQKAIENSKAWIRVNEHRILWALEGDIVGTRIDDSTKG